MLYVYKERQVQPLTVGGCTEPRRGTEGTGVLAIKQAPRTAQGALLSPLLGPGQDQAMICEKRQLPPGLVRLQ